MPFTDFTVQRLTATALNAAFDGVAPLGAYKSSDLPRSSTATVADDPDLIVPVRATIAYAVRVVGSVSAGSTTPDFKYAFAGPSGATMTNWQSDSLWDSGRTYEVRSAIGTTASIGCDTTQRPFTATGILVVGATAGNFSLQWAQNTSNATATTLYAGTGMWLVPIG